MRFIPLTIVQAALVFAACGTTEKTVVFPPSPGAAVVVPLSGDTTTVRTGD
jgi:hypothetical protein